MAVLRTDINSDTDILRSVAAWTPYPGAALDLDFINQKYWWGGALKTTGDFTTYVLNGATFGAGGLTMTNTTDISLALAGVGTMIPGAFAVSFLNTSAPGSARGWFDISNDATTNRVYCFQNTDGSGNTQVTATSVQAQIVGTGTTTLATRHGIASSYSLNDVKSSADGVTLTADVAATMPVGVVTLRPRGVSNNAALGALARVLLFASVKTQAELNALSTAMQAFSG